MKYIVRIKTEQVPFTGEDTSYVGPFDTSERAHIYAEDVQAFHGGEVREAYVEELHEPPEDY